ncbi:MAG: hypothetical protein K5629_04905 [Eubacteriales bacterium]|nr:hypothetical protein [Eubacteriales bacterium]
MILWEYRKSRILMILLLPDPGRNVQDRYYYHTLAKKDGIKGPGPNTLNKYQDTSNATTDTVDFDFTEKPGKVYDFNNSQTDSNERCHVRTYVAEAVGENKKGQKGQIWIETAYKNEGREVHHGENTLSKTSETSHPYPSSYNDTQELSEVKDSNDPAIARSRTKCSGQILLSYVSKKRTVSNAPFPIL